jgi:cytochrome c oxidase subunit 2
MIRLLRRSLPFVLLTLGAEVLHAQAIHPRYTRWWLPDQMSTAAQPIDNIFYIILWVTSVVFAGLFLTMIYFLIRYRKREGGHAIYSHGNNKLEIAWTVIPALILVFMAVISDSVWSDIKKDAPEEKDAFVVEVRPRQFQWDVRYAGSDGKFGTPDDLTSINQLHIPMGKPTLVKLTAQDVIHSFFVPEFRMKQDALPGMLTRIWFQPTKTGVIDIACAELCGSGHGRMKGTLYIESDADFQKWLSGEEAKKDSLLHPAPAPPAAAPVTTTTTTTTQTSPADTSHK